jgi:hypothetical protein
MLQQHGLFFHDRPHAMRAICKALSSGRQYEVDAAAGNGALGHIGLCGGTWRWVSNCPVDLMDPTQRQGTITAALMCRRRGRVMLSVKARRSHVQDDSDAMSVLVVMAEYFAPMGPGIWANYSVSRRGRSWQTQYLGYNIRSM